MFIALEYENRKIAWVKYTKTINFTGNFWFQIRFNKIERAVDK